MTLRDLILHEHSKRQCNIIEAWVGTSQKRFDELFLRFTGDESLVMQRAGWPLLHCVRANNGFIQNHISSLIRYLRRQDLHQACRRNGFGILDAIALPESAHGDVMDLCFRSLESQAESIAAKAFSIGILTRLSQIYPEITEEIKLLIQYQQQPLAPALKSRVAVFTRTAGHSD